MTWGRRSFLRTSINECATSPVKSNAGAAGATHMARAKTEAPQRRHCIRSKRTLPLPLGALDYGIPTQVTVGNRTNLPAADLHPRGLLNDRSRTNKEFDA